MMVFHILGLAVLLPSLVLGQGQDMNGNQFFNSNNFGMPQSPPGNNAAANTGTTSNSQLPSTQTANFGQPQASGTQIPNFGQPQASGTQMQNFGQPQAPGTQMPNFGQPQTPGTQMPNFGQPQASGTLPNSNSNFVQPPVTVNSNNLASGRKVAQPPLQGNFGGANQPVPTPFNAPTNTNQQPRPVQNNPVPMQQNGQQFSNVAPQGSVSPDQNFLNQGTPMNQMGGGRQMFSSFDPNNPTPFQPGQRINPNQIQPRPSPQQPGGNGFDFNRFGTPGFDQMTFRDQGLGTGQVDAVQFGVGPNDQPFRVDFGAQGQQTPFNNMNQGFGALPGLGGPGLGGPGLGGPGLGGPGLGGPGLGGPGLGGPGLGGPGLGGPGLGGPGLGGPGLGAQAGGNPMGPFMGQMPPMGGGFGGMPGAMPGMFGGGGNMFGGGGNSMFGGSGMFGMPPQPQQQGLFGDIGGFFSRIFGG